MREIEEARNALDTKTEVREDYDKQIDRLNAKRQKDRDELAKIKDAKGEAYDEYYTQLIEYEKQQQLIRDINWMNSVRQGLLEKKEK